MKTTRDELRSAMREAKFILLEGRTDHTDPRHRITTVMEVKLINALTRLHDAAVDVERMMKPTVPEVLPLVHRLYRGHDECTRQSGRVGGHLHIVLDDSNVEDNHVRSCLEDAREDQCQTCERIALLMLEMSKTQRLKLSRNVYVKEDQS